MVSFFIPSRAWAALCVAMLSAQVVSGRWSGFYNTTDVGFEDPPERCFIKSFQTGTRMGPCTCTGGKALPDCNWKGTGHLLSRVSEADCVCADRDGRNKLNQFTQKNRAQAVQRCHCDPPATKQEAGDGLLKTGPECWCPATELKGVEGLSEALGPADPPPPAGSDDRWVWGRPN